MSAKEGEKGISDASNRYAKLLLRNRHAATLALVLPGLHVLSVIDDRERVSTLTDGLSRRRRSALNVVPADNLRSLRGPLDKQKVPFYVGR